jgi:cobalamin biosynthesis protein CobT
VFVSKSRESVDFNQHRGRFDMKAFVSDASDQRRDVFSSIRPGSLDKAAVSIAIDNSASMSGQRITKAYQILGGLLYYLDKAGVPVEAAGFTAKDCYDSDHRDAPVVISVVKTFDEPFKGHPVLRCHPPAYCNLTIELDCLKFLAPRLYKRPEGKKVLFVLSDGEPCTGNSNLTRKLVVAYKEYIARLREVGIIVVGFGIDTDVTEYFGTDCINTQTNNLGEEIVKKLTEILNRR